MTGFVSTHARNPGEAACRAAGGVGRPVRSSARLLPQATSRDVGRRRRQPGVSVRAARFGLPLMLAIIAGRPEGFAPYVELYKERTGAARSAGAADRAALAPVCSGDGRRSARDPVALLHGAVRVGSARARLAATDLRAVPGRGRARLDVRLLPQFSSVGDGLTLDVRVECVEFPCSGHAFELVLAALYEVESGTRHEIANGACH
jgi:hypothetical protein